MLTTVPHSVRLRLSPAISFCSTLQFFCCSFILQERRTYGCALHTSARSMQWLLFLSVNLCRAESFYLLSYVHLFFICLLCGAHFRGFSATCCFLFVKLRLSGRRSFSLLLRWELLETVAVCFASGNLFLFWYSSQALICSR